MSTTKETVTQTTTTTPDSGANTSDEGKEGQG